MWLLGVDTSGQRMSVFAAKQDRLDSVYEAAGLSGQMHVRGISHSEEIRGLTERVQSDAGFAAREISLIAVSAGPGSFTGLRIGYSFAAGIALGIRARVVPVATFSTWAYSCLGHGRLTVCVSDAGRHELFLRGLFWGEHKCGSSTGIRSADSQTRFVNVILSRILPKRERVQGGAVCVP